ncbi:MAG: hypothetical protein ACU0BK_03685 [Shimia sp.]|jgi:hypothetical protein|uniref:hypothetical protein n=1 Tax=Shimia sp. TaxID=1954381 RepID=UPI0040594EA8
MSETNRNQRTADGEDCLISAEQIQRKLMAICRKIDQLQDPAAGPDNPLPIDIFLAEMVKRVNAPRIIFQPKRLNDLLWTESVTAYVYSGIERAFVKAGRLPGSKRAGHKTELEKLKAWVLRQTKNPYLKVPKFFVQKTALLFAAGILEERRPDRIEVLMSIQRCSPTEMSDLTQLTEWIDEDLTDRRLSAKGRSSDYQKIVFANEIAKLWKKLTGRPTAKKPDSNFGQFVVACWKSGFVDVEVNSSFKRILRHHIGQ